MSYPSSNRPAAPVFSSSLGFGATMRSGIAFGATALTAGTVLINFDYF